MCETALSFPKPSPKLGITMRVSCVLLNTFQVQVAETQLQLSEGKIKRYLWAHKTGESEIASGIT